MTININNFEPVNSSSTRINLFDVFDDPLTTGKVATFNFYEDSFSDEINILLFDQEGDGASATVNNFLNYVNDGDYINSIIHRSLPGFVIQGGGFIVEDFNFDLDENGRLINPTGVSNVPTDPPVINEFSPERSNTRGTIAMAKLGDDPNSATSQWFFNLDDNSANLDNQNGGFTVFGEVLSQSDLDAIDAIASVPVFSAPGINPAFENLPLDVDQQNPLGDLDDDNDFIRLENITVTDRPELSFSIEENTNPDLVNATVNSDGQINLDYATILNTPLFRFQSTVIPGTYLFALEEEAESIRRDFADVFTEEGLAFDITSSPNGDPVETGDAQITVKATNLLGESVSDTLQVSVTEDNIGDVDELIAFNRFRNKNVAGTYLYATEQESINIRDNFSNTFEEEGSAFYALGADASLGEEVIRFRSKTVQGTYLFALGDEANSVRENFPDAFEEEGVAFKVLT